MPKRSLNRSSRPGARTSGLLVGSEAMGLATETVVGVVSDDELPHNSCTAGEIGWLRSPAWNSERKIGSCCGSEAVFRSAER